MMKFWKYILVIYGRLLIFFLFPGFIVIPLILIPVRYLNSINEYNLAIVLLVVICFTIAFVVSYLEYSDAWSEIDNKKNNLQTEYKKLFDDLDRQKLLFETECNARKIKFEKECDRINKELVDKEEEIKALIYSETPFKKASVLASEMTIAMFSQATSYLKNKSHPALTSAQIVNELRKEVKKVLLKSKEIEYKYEYILNAFPEIAEYVESDEDLLSVGERYSYTDLEDMHDYRKNYLSQSEYNRLSEDEKSQLALDRYISSKKSKWEIGRDYEMSCAMQMQKRGYQVELHGIKYKLEDLGRDLIAKKILGGIFDDEILIIQCKNWSKDRIIHENVIYQLLGTSIEYQICNNNFNKEVIPMLMIPPHCSVSEMAVKVAERLKIRIERVPFNDFPRIKCNINHGERIYHLPFDQLYDRVEIKLPGEFYAWSVSEATRNGFRRAKRHLIS